MNFTIRKLTPELAEDYAAFFDATPHYENKDEDKCYCVTWRGDDSYVGDDHWYPTREERRERAVQFVKDGYLRGYLAYSGDRIVGWCNATADCSKGVDFMRSYWPIEERTDGVRVKSIFCYVVAPDAQRMGVATLLTERVCEDAIEEGFDYVEAYANLTHDALDFRGPLAMFEKCGFHKCAERDGRVVVRKALKN